MLSTGIEPVSTDFQSVANPSQLPKRNLVEMERLELPRENPADLQSAPIPIREHLQESGLYQLSNQGSSIVLRAGISPIEECPSLFGV